MASLVEGVDVDTSVIEMLSDFVKAGSMMAKTVDYVSGYKFLAY